MDDDPRFNFGRRWAVNPGSPQYVTACACIPTAGIDHLVEEGRIHWSKIQVHHEDGTQALRLAHMIADYLNEEGET